MNIVTKDEVDVSIVFFNFNRRPWTVEENKHRLYKRKVIDKIYNAMTVLRIIGDDNGNILAFDGNKNNYNEKLKAVFSYWTIVPKRKVII